MMVTVMKEMVMITVANEMVMIIAANEMVNFLALTISNDTSLYSVLFGLCGCSTATKVP